VVVVDLGQEESRLPVALAAGRLPVVPDRVAALLLKPSINLGLSLDR
jgi:hypothetical protein